VRLVAVLALSLALVGRPSAARPPTLSERAALIHATAAYIHPGLGVHLKYVSIRVSIVDPRWAVVVVRQWDASGHQVQGATFVWRSVRSRWAIENVGTADMGCGVPAAARKDLALYCPVSATRTPSPRAPLLSGCVDQRLVRPARIDFCGDGNFYLTGIVWAAWDTSGAVGAAVAHQNDCVPFCAGGHYHTYSAAVWLTRARTCSDGRLQFTRLSYLFLLQRPSHLSAGPHLVTAPLGVPAARCP
jgi:hypothetical protein